MLRSKIITEPLPVGWTAYRYGSEPDEPTGYALTQQEAIQDLHDAEEALLDAEDEMHVADLVYADAWEAGR